MKHRNLHGGKNSEAREIPLALVGRTARVIAPKNYGDDRITGQSRARHAALNYKILCLWMVHDNGRSGLLRLHVEARRQVHTDRLFRFEQRKDLGLVFQVGASRISKRV